MNHPERMSKAGKKGNTLRNFDPAHKKDHARRNKRLRKARRKAFVRKYHANHKAR